MRNVAQKIKSIESGDHEHELLVGHLVQYEKMMTKKPVFKKVKT